MLNILIKLLIVKNYCTICYFQYPYPKKNAQRYKQYYKNDLKFEVSYNTTQPYIKSMSHSQLIPRTIQLNQYCNSLENCRVLELPFNLFVENWKS